MNLMHVLVLLALAIALTFHEFAHAWSACLLGDQYPRRQGRVSLNPMRHLSLFGTLAVIVLHFGWGKPVMVNLYNFRHPKRYYLLSSLAGPAANLVLLGICAVLMLATRHSYAFGGDRAMYMQAAHGFLGLLALINAILAAINLLPVPPLDGSKIWPCLIPGLKPTLSLKTTWLFMLLLVFLITTDTLDPLFARVFDTVQTVLPESSDTHFGKGQDELEAGQAWLDEGWRAKAKAHYAKAEKRFDAVIAIDPSYPLAYTARAMARSRQGRLKAALADMDKAIELLPEHGEAYLQRARILTALGDHERAVADVETARRLGADAPPPAPQAATSAPASRPTTTAP